MKRTGIGALAVLTLFVSCGLLRRPLPAKAQGEQSQAWLEGRLADPDGHGIGNNAVISVWKDGKAMANMLPDGDMRGYYAFRSLRPGTYEIRVGKNTIFPWRPIRVFGVVVKPCVRNILDVQIDEGDGIKEIGQPEVATQKVLIITEELQKLQRQIDELKKNP